MLKRLSFFTFLGLISLFSFACAVDGQTTYHIYSDNYAFSTVFEVNGSEGLVCRIHKTPFHWKTHYDLVDQKETLVAQGMCPFLSVGAFSPKLAQIDVFAQDGKKIGAIEGKISSIHSLSFQIFDEDEQLLATAYLDNPQTGFVIVDGSKPLKQIGSLTEEDMDEGFRRWNLTLEDKGLESFNLLAIFAAFTCDHAQAFYINHHPD
jgi:hypothetical protein